MQFIKQSKQAGGNETQICIQSKGSNLPRPEG